MIVPVLRLLGAAMLLTLLNAFKPVVVDDTAYLIFARHLSQHPLDPYGFTLFWYWQPDSAMDVLMPPVLPYWLGLGIAIFGENLFLLKLWLFPFALLLGLSVQHLLKRFAPGQADGATPLIVLSAFVLPLFNFMLDLPALSLGLAALVAFLRAAERSSWGWSLLSGGLLALALQTKYSMLTMPVVLVGAALVFGGWRQLVLVAFSSALLFGGWELVLWSQYGTSHFLRHVQEQSAEGDWLTRKGQLLTPLLTFLGFLAGGWGLYAGRAVGFPRWVVWLMAAYGLLGTLLIVFTPGQQAILLQSSTGTVRLDLPTAVFGLLGIGLLLTLSLAAFQLLMRWPSGRIRWKAASLFLLGWLLLELLAYFVLTPFPAGRRVLGISLVVALLAARLVGLRSFREQLKPGAVPKIYLLLTGLGLFALDSWDAWPERALADQAAQVAQPEAGGQIWTQGHWGWQYYTERQGMQLVHPGHTLCRAGDLLVLPVEPDPIGFYRPFHGFANFQLEAQALELLKEFVWDDGLAGQTIPNLYGGFAPIIGRDHPRLRVRVYRITQDWTPLR